MTFIHNPLSVMLHRFLIMIRSSTTFL